MERFKKLFESKDSVKHGKYTITYTEGEDGDYFFITKGKDFIGSIALDIGETGVHEDIRELTRSDDKKIESNRDLQKLINQYLK